MVRLISYFYLASVALFASSSSEARQWKTTPLAEAQDYAVIIDSRPVSNEQVILLWLSPQIIPDSTPNVQLVKDLLNKYLVIGVVDAALHTDGTIAFSQIDPPAMSFSTQGSNSPSLVPAIAQSSLPPTMLGAMTGMQAVFTQSLGKFGSGIKWFYFDGSAVDTCKAGRLSIPAASETYTYDLPLPNCP